MTSLNDLKPGDRVQVFDVNGSRVGQPPGGWDGEVHKVGRTLIHVVYGYGDKPHAFRLSNGQRNDAYGHQSLKTPEQAAADERRRNLVVRLRHHGVELGSTVLPTDKLEAIATILDAP